MASLFDKAKKSAPAKKVAAKDEKVRIRIEDATFFDKVEKLEQLNDTMKSAKAKADMISDELKGIAIEKWCELYEEKGKNPDSIMLEHVKEGTDDTGQFMFVPSDKYITITEARAEELQEAYGDEIVEEKTVFSFDASMIEKYGEILSQLIEDSEEIAEKDKEKIIRASTTYSIAKGTIDNFTKLGSVAELFEMTKPVVSIKNAGVIKG